MFFTGYLSSIGSYFISLPWSGGAFWALLRPTLEIFAISSWAPEVAVPFNLLNGDRRGVLFVHLSVLQLARMYSLGDFLSVWNGLPLALRLLPNASDAFCSSLKTLLFSRARVGSASE